MTPTPTIAGYTRISVDDELDRDNVSIENQKSIIADYVEQNFPGSALTFFEDRDRSGYTFDQREGYRKLRADLFSHKFDILIIKDFSRFSRRNGRGLAELEDLRDAGVRIISIGDGIDFPNDNEWMKIQFHFLLNEMPVTDASRKVKSVISRRQQDGSWICAAPYGYIVNRAHQFEIVPTEAEIVREIFRLYIDGWGYKRIANHLTEQGIPTPRMSEQLRREAEGLPTKRKNKAAWALVTVQGILDNDFYIGTLRQGKYSRAKINGRDLKRAESEQIVLEHHHQAIIDYRTFATAKALRENRSTSHYRGVKKYDNVYSGFLFCGDCGSPMFSMSRPDLRDAYRCGEYHRRGLKGCTSHHIRVDRLDELLKSYVRAVRENSAAMIARLNADLEREGSDIAETERAEENLDRVLAELHDELKATKRQRIRDIMKHPENEALLDETYDEMESELLRKIDGLTTQIQMQADKRNTIIRVNRAAKLALDVFADIASKEKLERTDLELIIDRISVYEDRIEIKLKSDVDTLLRCGELPEEAAANFKSDTGDISTRRIVQRSAKRPDKVFGVRVINSGDSLEIYTDKDGEVIFKKYSPMGELNAFAAQLCETLAKTAGASCAVCDRDSVIAAAGEARREVYEKRISPALEELMEERRFYTRERGEREIALVEGGSAVVAIAAPILAEGDISGCVVFLAGEADTTYGDAEQKLAQTVAGFLGRQMES